MNLKEDKGALHSLTPASFSIKYERCVSGASQTNTGEIINRLHPQMMNHSTPLTVCDGLTGVKRGCVWVPAAASASTSRQSQRTGGCQRLTKVRKFDCMTWNVAH